MKQGMEEDGCGDLPGLEVGWEAGLGSHAGDTAALREREERAKSAGGVSALQRVFDPHAGTKSPNGWQMAALKVCRGCSGWPGWVGSRPSAFPADLLRSGRAAYVQSALRQFGNSSRTRRSAWRPSRSFEAKRHLLRSRHHIGAVASALDPLRRSRWGAPCVGRARLRPAVPTVGAIACRSRHNAETAIHVHGHTRQMCGVGSREVSCGQADIVDVDEFADRCTLDGLHQE
jgi:hypothetical protein